MLERRNKITRKKKIHYPVLTIILFLSLIYIGINAMGNVIKLASFNYKLMELQLAYENAKNDNNSLREELNSYSIPDVITYKVIPQKNSDENLVRKYRY